MPVGIQAGKHLGALVEGEKIANAGVRVRPNGGRGIIKDEMIVALLAELGKIFPHIVIIVAVVVQLEQAGHVLITRFF